MMFCYYNLSNWKHGQGKKFLRFLSGLVSLPTQCHEGSKVLRKSSYGYKGDYDHLQCNVKRTRWSDYVSRVDLSLSFLSSPSQKRQKQKTMATLPMCWSFFIIWQSCTHSSERLKMRYESLRNVAMHLKVFKCVKNAFHSSAVSHTPTFWAKDVWCYDAYFVTNYVKETVTQLEKDKTALADQYTWVTPLPYL